MLKYSRTVLLQLIVGNSINYSFNYNDMDSLECIQGGGVVPRLTVGRGTPRTDTGGGGGSGGRTRYREGNMTTAGREKQ
jgi:hypothetical protein